MKINGWWLSVGIMSSIDYFYNTVLEYTWVTSFNVLCVFIGFGLAFKQKPSQDKRLKK